MNYLSKAIKRYKECGYRVATKHFLRLFFSYLKRPFIILFTSVTNRIIVFEKRFTVKESIIVFECESDMEDNPRAIYECLLQNDWNKKNRVVWLVQDVVTCKHLYKEKNVIFLNRNNKSNINQIRLNYYLSRAKWFFFSHPYWFHKKRAEQVIIHTDHGVAVKGREKNGPDVTNCYDWILVPTEFCKPLTKAFWLCSCDKMIMCGRPANEFLFTEKKIDIKKIIKNYSGEKIIICMPTYKRSVMSVDCNLDEKYLIDVIHNNKELLDLNDLLKEQNIQLILKPHPLQVIDDLEEMELSNIHFVFNRELFLNKIVLYELLSKCDALISDVSSVYTDFLILNRPLAFFMQSVNNYSRGFALKPIEQYMPGERIYNYNDLKRFCINVATGNDNYSDERIAISSFFNAKEANSSQHLLESLEIL